MTYLLIGFVIALAVGLTGIGGGSFTVPALLLIGGVALDGSASDESEEPALQPVSAQRYKISRWHNPLILRSKQAMPRALRYKRS